MAIELAPPWDEFPEPPSSLRWRMGPGEDYITEWVSFWRRLPATMRQEYLVRHPPPAEWKEWVWLVAPQ